MTAITLTKEDTWGRECGDRTEWKRFDPSVSPGIPVTQEEAKAGTPRDPPRTKVRGESAGWEFPRTDGQGEKRLQDEELELTTSTFTQNGDGLVNATRFVVKKISSHSPGNSMHKTF